MTSSSSYNTNCKTTDIANRRFPIITLVMSDRSSIKKESFRLPPIPGSLILLLLALSLWLCSPATSKAAEFGDLNFVTDDAGILSESQLSELESMAENISRQYGYGVYIVTIDDYTEYGNSMSDVTNKIYDGFNLGYGDTREGILLLLSMDDRDYYVVVNNYGPLVFSNEGREMLADYYFLPRFRDDDWFGGFSEYLEGCEEYLLASSRGTPITGDNKPEAAPGGFIAEFPMGLPGVLGVFIAGGSVGALLVVGGLSMQLKNVSTAEHAQNYVSGSLNLTERQDIYTHTTRHIVEKRDDSGSSGGGGGGSSGGGRSGGGGKF